MTRRTAPQASFDDQLVLFRYFLHELKVDSISALSEKLNGSEYEGVNESGNTYFYTYIARICQMRGAAVTPEKLRLYDENICRHTRQIGEKRGGLQWKYFQYVACSSRKCIWIGIFPTRTHFALISMHGCGRSKTSPSDSLIFSPIRRIN